MNAPSRILVVDDNSTNRLVLAKSLEKAGYEVLTANDGFEGVEAATRQQPDLVLLDMMMPGRDGIEVCTILKAQKETSTIPIVFVTAVSEAEQILKAFATAGTPGTINRKRDYARALEKRLGLGKALEVLRLPENQGVSLLDIEDKYLRGKKSTGESLNDVRKEKK